MRTWVAPTDTDLRKFVCVPGKHSLARLGGIRRILSIPNPIAHFNLISIMDAGHATITKHIKRSRWTASEPKYKGAKDRAVVPRTLLGDLPLLRAKNRALGHFVLLADIADFYRSVYTHSIPWVLHTKSTAKSQRNDLSLLGNRIDLAIRNGQSQQTKGIPIGPDSSLVIAELVAAAIDSELQQVVKPLHAFRYYDDYELTFETRSEAEAALALLQQILSSYELDLNPTKTAIRELPIASERPWILRIRDYEFGAKRASPPRIIGFFDEVFELRQREPNSYVIGYAISRLEKVGFSTESWPLIERLLAQSVLAEPSAMPQFARFLVAQKLRGCSPTKPLLEGVVNSVITTGAPLGHSSEVAWALWAAIMFKLMIDTGPTNKLAQMTDPIAILLALDADSRGCMRSRLPRTQWTKLMTASSLRNEHWLLAYEANVRGWLANATNDHVAADASFSKLRTAKVNFYIPKFDVSRRLLAMLSPRRGQSYGDDDSDDTGRENDIDDDDDDDDVDDVEIPDGVF